MPKLGVAAVASIVAADRGGWGYRGGYYPAYGYGYAAYGGCWRTVRVAGPYGWGWRRVWVCG